MNDAKELLGAIARGWCHPKNEGKVMDPDLAIAIAAEVNALLSSEANGEAVGLLRRIRKANIIFPSMCANNMEAYNLLDEIDKFLASQSDTNSEGKP